MQTQTRRMTGQIAVVLSISGPPGENVLLSFNLCGPLFVWSLLTKDIVRDDE